MEACVEECVLVWSVGNACCVGDHDCGLCVCISVFHHISVHDK